MPKRRVQQPTMKQRLSHVSHEYKHVYQYPNNILSGDQPLQVLNYQLATFSTYKVESLNWQPNTAKGFPCTSGYLDHLCLHTIHPC